MGRMLEALKHTPEIAAPEPVLHAEPAVDDREPPEEVMPFVEVGGPRKANASRPAPEVAGPRLASLFVPAANVRLQPLSRPALPVADELIAFHQPEHAVSQQYGAVFLQMAPEAGDRACAFLLTSLAGGAGTTTTVLNLAITGCRQHQRRIVVVDANRTRPGASRRLGLEATVGLHEVVHGSVALEQAILATPQSELQVLPAGIGAAEGGPWPADALRWVLAWLRQRFDVVLVDGPAWNDPPLPRTLGPLVDAVYLVVEPAQARQPAVRDLTRSVTQLGGRVGGLILT